MKAVILAAGRGVRLNPITEDIPKCLIPLHGKTLLIRQIESLLKNGVSDIAVVGGYHVHLIEQVLSNRRDFPVKLILNSEYGVTNNMASLYLTRDFLSNEPFFLINGDVVYEEALWQKLLKGTPFPVCPYDSGQDDDESLKLKLDSRNIPLEILPKKTLKPGHQGCVMGSFGFSKEATRLLFDDIETVLKAGQCNEWFEYSLSRIFPSIDFNTLDVAGYDWIEIDNEEDYRKAERIFE